MRIRWAVAVVTAVGLAASAAGCTGRPAADAAPDPARAAASAPSAPPAAPVATPAASASVRASATTEAAAAPSSRDKFRWPFAATSVWNTPIGSKARYARVSIGSTGVGTDVVYVHRVKASDPVVPSYDANAFVGTRCSGRKAQQQAQWHPGLDTIRIADDLLFPDANLNPSSYSTPNGKLTLLMPDGKTVRSLQPACRTRKGGPLYGYAFPPQSVYGDGLCCGHGGSGLSAMGGIIRTGELTGKEPIRHALAVNLWGDYLYYDRTTGSGHVWPAPMHDGTAPTTYKGRDPDLRMGTLLAIPPSVTEASLKLETPAGRKLFRAMQDYGAYVVDDSGQNTQDLNIEKGEVDALRRTVTGGRDIGRFGPLARDFTAIMKKVQAVSNNAPGSVGGGGKPRAPRAPKIRN